MGGAGFVGLGTESEERHGVTMSTHCEVKGKFLQIVREGEVLEEEVCVLSWRTRFPSGVVVRVGVVRARTFYFQSLILSFSLSYQC